MTDWINQFRVKHFIFRNTIRHHRVLLILTPSKGRVLSCALSQLLSKLFSDGQETGCYHVTKPVRHQRSEVHFQCNSMFCGSLRNPRTTFPRSVCRHDKDALWSREFIRSTFKSIKICVILTIAYTVYQCWQIHWNL